MRRPVLLPSRLPRPISKPVVADAAEELGSAGWGRDEGWRRKANDGCERPAAPTLDYELT